MTNKKFKGVAILGVNSLAMAKQICGIVGDDSLFTQNDFEDKTARDNLFFCVNERENSWHFWDIKKLPKDANVISYKEFIKKFSRLPNLDNFRA